MRALRSLPVVLLALFLTAAPAHAHVRLDPASAPAGETARLTFRVPNEREATATVQLQLQLPAPFEQVEPGDVEGWEHRVEDDVVIWEGGRIEPGERAEFPLLVGPLPPEERLVFPAVQTYEDGEVVRWIEEGEGADHPAPVLVVTGGGGAPVTTTTVPEHGGDEVASTTAAAPDETTTTTLPVTPDGAEEETEGDEGVPAAVWWVGGIALVALVVAGLVALNRRDPTRTP